MIGTLVIAAALTVLAVYAVVSYRKTLSNGCCGSGDKQNAGRVIPADMDPAHYPYCRCLTIEGMHCAACARRLENAFHQREGLLAHADVGKGRVVVRSKTQMEDGQLCQIVAASGYRVIGSVE